MLRRIRDLGVEPFLSLGGFAGDPQTERRIAESIWRSSTFAPITRSPSWSAPDPGITRNFPTFPNGSSTGRRRSPGFTLGLEKALRHAESVRVTIALKPHTGITARGRDCMQVLKRIQSPWLKIAWDAGNISFYEGVYPDPDLPDVAPQVKAVCIKDHLGLRGDENFPIPGQGNVDHELMFRTLFAAGFNGPLAIERVDGRDGFGNKAAPEIVDKRLTAAYQYLAPLLDRITTG